MTKPGKAKINKLISLLGTAREIADQLELTNGSGGELGSLIGSIADELEVNVARSELTPTVSSKGE